MEADIKVPEMEVKDSKGNLMEDSTQKLNDQIEAYTNEIKIGRASCRERV